MASKYNCDSKVDEYEISEEDIEMKRKTIMKELQNQVDDVDVTVAKLANSFDSLHNILKSKSDELQEQIKQQFKGEQSEANSILTKTAENMSDLIVSAEDVQKIKVEAIKSLSKLIHFIHADREEICTDTYLDMCRPLNIDTYIKSREFSSENADILIEMLKEQNKRLQQKYKLSRKHVQIVSQRETILNDEQNQLREHMMKLQNQLQTLSAMESSDSITCEDDCFASEQYNNSKLYHREHADGGLSNHHGDKSSMNPHHQNPIKCSIDQKVQTDNSEENSHDQLEKQIEELQLRKEEIEATLAVKERLLRLVVFRNAYEVNVVHQNSNKQSRLELELIKRMNEGMEQKQCSLKVKKDTHVQSDSKYITIVTCALMPKNRSWESVLKAIEYPSTDHSKIILVVFYECVEKKKLEASVVSMCDTLQKFRSVFQLQCCKNLLYRCPDEMQAILQIIIDNGNERLEVANCSNCEKR